MLALISAGATTASATTRAPGNTKPAKVKPVITLTPVAAVPPSVRPLITVSFAPPKGVAAKNACKGKLKISAPTGAKKTIRRKGKKVKVKVIASKRASIKNIGGTCTAAGAPKLPATLIGKTVKFSAEFAGGATVKKFKKSAKLVLSVPAPPPARIDPVKGAWTLQGKDMTGNWVQWTFQVLSDGSVAALNRIAPLRVNCPSSPGSFPVATDVAIFDTPFSMTFVDLVAADNFQGDSQNIDSTLKLHFDAAGHATGTFQMIGTIRGPNGILAEMTTAYPNCDSGLISVEAAPGSFM